VLLQMGLVEKSAVRDNRPSNGDEMLPPTFRTNLMIPET
jgi:hypothetical protein